MLNFFAFQTGIGRVVLADFDAPGSFVASVGSTSNSRIPSTLVIDVTSGVQDAINRNDDILAFRLEMQGASEVQFIGGDSPLLDFITSPSPAPIPEPSNPIPEPSTMLLLGSGLAGLEFFMKPRTHS